MASLTSIIVGAVQLVAGIALTSLGVGGGIGLKLILSGALSLISSFMATSTGRNGLSSSPRYGFTNLSNRGREGGCIPVIYGEEVVAPTLISTNLKQEGGKSILYLEYAVCEGEVGSFADVKLNGTAIAQYAGATYETRAGTASQLAIAGFDQTGAAYDVSTRLNLSATHVFEMHADSDELVIALAWQGGVYYQKDDGSLKGVEPTLKIEWQALDTLSPSIWNTFDVPTVNGKQIQGTGNADYWDNKYKVAGQWTLHPVSTRSAYFNQIRLPIDGTSSRPPRGKYRVRLTGMAADDGLRARVPTVTSFVEIQNGTRTYPNTALLAIKAPAAEQLGGSVPTVTVKVKATKVYDPRTATTAWSRNPAVCVRDLLVNTRYGLGEFITSAMIDDGVGGTWRTVMDACDADVSYTSGVGATAVLEDHWQLDYVLDTIAPGFDHLSQMTDTFRATLFCADGKVFLTQDTTGTSQRSFEDRVAASSANRRNVGHEGDAAGWSDRSLLSADILDESSRWTVVKMNYVDRDKAFLKRAVEVRTTSIAVGAITGTYQAGEVLKCGTARGRFVFQRAGVVYYTQDEGASAFATATAVVGATSGATSTSTAAPVTNESPEHALEKSMFGVTRRSQAVRESRYQLNRALMTPIIASWPVGLGDLDLIPGDVVDVSTDAPAAWAAKLFTTLTLAFGQDGNGQIVAREYNADVFVDTVDTAALDSPAAGSGPTPGGMQKFNPDDSPTAGKSVLPPATSSSSSSTTAAKFGTVTNLTATASAKATTQNA